MISINEVEYIMKVKTFPLGPMMTNCFLAWKEDKTAYFFDCGGKNLEKLEQFVKQENLDMKYLVLTHGHGDHIDGIYEFLKLFPNASLYIGEEEKEFFRKLPIKNEIFRKFTIKKKFVENYL